LVTIYEADRRKQAEESFKTSEERLQLAKEAAGLAVFDFDSNQNVLHWDEKMRELWGAESEESTIPYKRFITAIHPDDRAARQASLETAINPKGNGEYRAEYRVINPATQAERWVSSVGRMHFEDGVATRLVGVARDITEQKLLERKLQEQRAETESISQQMVAAHTASAIAHELNQPLAAISAYSEVALHALQAGGHYPDNLKRALEGCVAQAQRAGGSLHELLAFLQKGDLVTERFNLNEAVKEALTIARGSGYVEFHPVLQLEEKMPAVLGNRIQVQKILVNLLRNAVEAMRGAGLKSSAITVQVSTNAAANMAHVSVQDQGPGLDAETTKRIFEPFFTTKTSGIGMGLAISRALTEANGGQLWLDQNTAIGASFHFTLPFAP
jgi:PAS domain S-box-containing protein